MLFKINKLNISTIDFFIISLENIDEKQLNILEEINNICNYKNKTFINNFIILYFDCHINIKELNNMINTLFKKVLKFNIYLIKFNNKINFLNIKVTKIDFQDKILNVDYEYFNSLISFLEKNIKFKKFNNNNFKSWNVKKCESNKNKNLLMLKNFNELNIDLLKLLNLFYIFGNINAIYYNFYANTIYISYESLIALNRILMSLDSLIVNNILLDISICNFSYKNKNYFIRPIVIKRNLNLYNNKYYKIKFNRPSKVIMICNISINFNLFDFYKIICKYSSPLFLKLKKNKCKKSYVWLMKFDNIKESINVLIHISNSNYINNRLRINFSSKNIAFN